MKVRVPTAIYSIPAICFSIFFVVIVIDAISYYNALKEGKANSVEYVTEGAITLIEAYKNRVDDGEMSLEEAQNEVVRLLRNYRFAGGQDVFIVNYNRCMVLSSNPENEKPENCSKSPDVRGPMVEAARSGGGLLEYQLERNGDYLDKISYLRPYDTWQWAVGAGIFIDDIEAEFNASMLQLGGLTLLAMVLAAVLSWFVASRISVSVAALKNNVATIAEGNYETPVVTDSRFRELSDMALGVLALRDKSAMAQKLEAEAAEQKKRAEQERRKNILGIAENLQKDVGSIASSVDQSVGESSKLSSSMSENAGGILSHSEEVASAASDVSQNVDSVAAATEELSASIHEINQQVTQMTDTVVKATTESESATNDVTGLSEAVDKIQEIVNLINDIAGQTNLLALNATIEAARAGEAGKGFAVVASEVKNLATQTGRATEEIAAQINNVVQGTQRAVSGIAQVTETISLVRTASTAIAAAIEEQGAATQEIAGSANLGASGVRQISQSVDETMQLAKNTNLQAHDLQAASTSLADRSEELTRIIKQFSDGLVEQANE